MNVEGTAHWCWSEQGSASQRLAQQQWECHWQAPECWQRCCSLHQAWLLFPSHRDGLRLEYVPLCESLHLSNQYQDSPIPNQKPFVPSCPTPQLWDTSATISLCNKP